MAIPEIRSNHIALWTPHLPKFVHTAYNRDGIRRDARKREARKFRDECYVYGRNMDNKTCIWPGGDYSWLDESSGIEWVGVCANDWICIVTKARDLDVRRVHGWLIFQVKEVTLSEFRESVVPEIEDIADPSSKLYKMLGQTIKKPFGIVSVQDGHERGEEIAIGEYEEDKCFKIYLEEFNRNRKGLGGESGSDANDEDDIDKEYRLAYKKDIEERPSFAQLGGFDEKESIKYIQEEMKNNSDTTFQETINKEGAIKFLKMRLNTGDAFSRNSTILCAISAFQLLFGKKLNANDIGVSILNPKDPKHMNIKKVDQSSIERHLAELKLSDKNYMHKLRERQQREQERKRLELEHELQQERERERLELEYELECKQKLHLQKSRRQKVQQQKSLRHKLQQQKSQQRRACRQDRVFELGNMGEFRWIELQT